MQEQNITYAIANSRLNLHLNAHIKTKASEVKKKNIQIIKLPTKLHKMKSSRHFEKCYYNSKKIN